jgi:hypothetical protein
MAAVTVAGRVVLAVCAVLSVVGGGALVVLGVVYFTADQYLASLNDVGDGILAGAVGLGLYTGGALRVHPAVRVVAGIGATLVGYLASMIFASVVSMFADPGGPRGNLEAAAAGLVWLLAGAFFGWQAVSRRWPSRSA